MNPISKNIPNQALIHYFLEFRPSLQMALYRCLSHSLQQANIHGCLRMDILRQAKQNWRETVGNHMTKVFFSALEQELEQAGIFIA